jgi:hypothetical protein
MSYIYAGLAVATLAASVYSSNKQAKIAKDANAKAERQNRIQAEDNVNAAKIRQEQNNKVVADIADTRTNPQQTKLRKQQGIISRSLNL